LEVISEHCRRFANSPDIFISLDASEKVIGLTLKVLDVIVPFTPPSNLRVGKFLPACAQLLATTGMFVGAGIIGFLERASGEVMEFVEVGSEGRVVTNVDENDTESFLKIRSGLATCETFEELVERREGGRDASSRVMDDGLEGGVRGSIDGLVEPFGEDVEDEGDRGAIFGIILGAGKSLKRMLG